MAVGLTLRGGDSVAFWDGRHASGAGLGVLFSRDPWGGQKSEDGKRSGTAEHGHNFTQTRVTPKGIQWIADRYASELML